MGLRLPPRRQKSPRTWRARAALGRLRAGRRAWTARRRSQAAGRPRQLRRPRSRRTSGAGSRCTLGAMRRSRRGGSRAQTPPCIRQPRAAGRRPLRQGQWPPGSASGGRTRAPSSASLLQHTRRQRPAGRSHNRRLPQRRRPPRVRAARCCVRASATCTPRTSCRQRGAWRGVWHILSHSSVACCWTWDLLT